MVGCLIDHKEFRVAHIGTTYIEHIIIVTIFFCYSSLTRVEEARQVLQKIRPADADIDAEVEAIKQAVSGDVDEESCKEFKL